jgi:hypothetical protein
MKLQAIGFDLLYHLFYPVSVFIHQHSGNSHEWRHSLSDSNSSRKFDSTRAARMKYEANRIPAQLRYLECVYHLGNATNFYSCSAIHCSLLSTWYVITRSRLFDLSSMPGSLLCAAGE